MTTSRVCYRHIVEDTAAALAASGNEPLSLASMGRLRGMVGRYWAGLLTFKSQAPPSMAGYEGVAGFAEVTGADAAALCDTGAGSLANDLPEAWLHPDALPRNTATRRAIRSLRPELFEQDQT